MMKTGQASLLLLGLVMATTLNLSGCATPATSQAMTVQPATTAPVNPILKGSIKLGEVTGGKDTNPMWTSQVDNASFKKALNDSLAISGYLASGPEKAKYEVTANLAELDQPLFGLTFDVRSNVSYQLSGEGTVRTYPVNVTGTATTSDAFIAIERLRIANERSVMENIKAFINELAKFVP
jgi:uncharacterized lipoprotein YajG